MARVVRRDPSMGERTGIGAPAPSCHVPPISRRWGGTAVAASRSMVGELGMSDGFGSLSIASMAGGSAGRPEASEPPEKTKERIDAEATAILESQRRRAEKVLAEFRPEMDRLVAVLLEKRKLKLDDVKEVFGGREFKKAPDAKEDA